MKHALNNDQATVFFIGVAVGCVLAAMVTFLGGLLLYAIGVIT